MTETTPRIRSQAVITDRLGLHLRPASQLVGLARTFRSDIRILCKGATADAKSLLELLVLAIGCGTTVELVAHGPDAEQAVFALIDLINPSADCAVAA